MRCLLVALGMLAALAACSSNPPGIDLDSGTDADSDADSDTDSDADADADADADTDADTDTCDDILDWVPITGGTFMMGGPEDTPDNIRLPVHEVNVPSFELTRTEITAAQYRCCYLAEACTEPQPSGPEPDDVEDCNWDLPEEADRPINCVNWQQAVDFCEWAGGRLLSESEWEYAARSEGKDNTYPWGEEPPTCEYAVMDEWGGVGCTEGRTWDACSKPAGNTEQGLCDMAGNVAEWVEDCFHTSYYGAPGDGSAWTTECSGVNSSVIRGGSYSSSTGSQLDCRNRMVGTKSGWGFQIGIRCAR